MLDEQNRQSYLKAMGVTQWKLRTTEEQPIITQDASFTVKESVKPIIDKPVSETPVVEIKNEIKKTIKGLKWLNQGSKNGLLVILADQRKKLSPESRELMSKMLKGIQFLPSETGFAISGENLVTEQEFSLEGIKAILVLGNDAGRELVRFSGAKIIPGTEYFSLDKRKVVITVHPDELLANPEHKQQVWNDLKQLVHFFNND